jgi:hypothetical protein
MQKADMKKMWKLAGAAGLSTLMAASIAAHGAGMGAPAADDHPSQLRPYNLPPSAELAYSISARQRGFALNGDATLSWRQGDGKYTINTDSRVALLGKLTENRSQGTIDSFGLAPAEYYDKRFRKDPVTANFDREAKTISFSDGKQIYPIKGGEQDRVSVSWQLIAVARAAKDKFRPGSEWRFFVVGPHDADPWTFRVIGREKVQAGAAIGSVDTVHVLREPPPGSKDQTLDIWLAPSLEWYPVKLRFVDNDRDYVEQTLERVTRK